MGRSLEWSRRLSSTCETVLQAVAPVETKHSLRWVTMPLLMPGGANYIGVRNVAGTVSWYTEKLGLRKVPIELDDGEDCVALGFATDEAAFVLGPTGKSSGELTPLLYSSNVNKERVAEIAWRKCWRRPKGSSTVFSNARSGREH